MNNFVDVLRQSIEKLIDEKQQLTKERDTMINDNISTHEMWDSLNEELWDRRTEMTEMKIVIAQLHRERDEARREVCDLMNMDWIGCVEKGNKETAISRGWDCYEKETH